MIALDGGLVRVVVAIPGEAPGAGIVQDRVLEGAQHTSLPVADLEPNARAPLQLVLERGGLPPAVAVGGEDVRRGGQAQDQVAALDPDRDHGIGRAVLGGVPAVSRSRQSPGGARDVSHRARNPPTGTGNGRESSLDQASVPHATSSAQLPKCASVAWPSTSTLALTRCPATGSVIATSGGTVSTSTVVATSPVPPQASVAEKTTT